MDRDRAAPEPVAKPRRDTTQLFLTLVVAVLLLTNVGLFLRMNELQRQVLQVLQPAPPPTGLEPGNPAPAIDIADVEGSTAWMETLGGESYVLVFSSPTCPACQEFWPTLAAFHRTHGAPIVMVSKGTQEEIATMILEQGFDFPVVPWDESVARAYHVPGTPYLFVVDGRGTISFSGFADEMSELEAALSAEGGGGIQ